MGYSYDPTQLQTSPLYQVRFAIGDTEVNDPATRYLADEEIQYLIDTFGIDEGAAQAAERIAAKLSRFADQKTGKISVSYSQLSDKFRALAASIRQNGIDSSGTGAVETFAGGITRSFDELIDGDPDRKRNIFDVGITDIETDEPEATTCG